MFKGQYYIKLILLAEIPGGEGVGFLIHDDLATKGSEGFIIVASFLFKFSHAEVAGFNIDCRRILKFISVCVINTSQRFGGKSSAIPVRVSDEWALNVQMAYLAALRRWRLGGTSW